MKLLGLFQLWLFLAGSISLTLVAMQRTQADPTDDFSYLLGREANAAHVETSLGSVDWHIDWQWMSEEQLGRIFRSRLDLFPNAESPKLGAHLLRLCQRYAFDPAFVLAMIEVESRFRIKVVSPMGAVGLMQLMPATAAIVAERFQIPYTGARALTDPYTNLSIGVAYLSMLRDQFKGHSPYYQIAAYNVGPARMGELLARKYFRPVQTKAYYEKIRQITPSMRNEMRNELNTEAHGV